MVATNEHDEKVCDFISRMKYEYEAWWCRIYMKSSYVYIAYRIFLWKDNAH